MPSEVDESDEKRQSPSVENQINADVKENSDNAANDIEENVAEMTLVDEPSADDNSESISEEQESVDEEIGKACSLNGANHDQNISSQMRNLSIVLTRIDVHVESIRIVPGDEHTSPTSLKLFFRII